MKTVKVIFIILAGVLGILVVIALLAPNPPSKPTPTGETAQVLADNWAPDVTDAFALYSPSGAVAPIGEINKPNNQVVLDVYLWAEGTDPLMGIAKDIIGVLAWENTANLDHSGALPKYTTFVIGYGTGQTFDNNGDRPYVDIAYDRDVIEKNGEAIYDRWLDMSFGHKAPNVDIFNAASNVAVVYWGRPVVRKFCAENSRAAGPFCMLVEKNISLQDKNIAKYSNQEAPIQVPQSR